MISKVLQHSKLGILWFMSHVMTWPNQVFFIVYSLFFDHQGWASPSDQEGLICSQPSSEGEPPLDSVPLPGRAYHCWPGRAPTSAHQPPRGCQERGRSWVHFQVRASALRERGETGQQSPRGQPASPRVRWACLLPPLGKDLKTLNKPPAIPLRSPRPALAAPWCPGWGLHLCERGTSCHLPGLRGAKHSQRPFCCPVWPSSGFRNRNTNLKKIRKMYCEENQKALSLRWTHWLCD